MATPRFDSASSEAPFEASRQTGSLGSLSFPESVWLANLICSRSCANKAGSCRVRTVGRKRAGAALEASEELGDELRVGLVCW